MNNDGVGSRSVGDGSPHRWRYGLRIELPCNIGDTVYIKAKREAHVAECVGFKVRADSVGVSGQVLLRGIFGIRKYSLSHFGRTLFPKSD